MIGMKMGHGMPLRGAKTASLLLGVLVVLALSTGTSAGSTTGSVLDLNSKNFRKVIDGVGEKPIVVSFTAPWCGHCKSLKPKFVAAAEKTSGIVTFANVDCDEASNKKLCSQYDVRGFPTVKVFKNGKAQDYKGARETNALVSGAYSAITNTVKTVKSEEKWTEIVEGVKLLPAVMLVSEKKMPTPLYKALALDFKDALQFVLAPSDQEYATADVSIESYPSVFLMKVKEGEEAELEYIKFEDTIGYVSIRTWLEQFAERSFQSPWEIATGEENIAETKKKSNVPNHRAAKKESVPKQKLVRELTASSYDEICVDSKYCVIATASSQAEEAFLMEALKRSRVVPAMANDGAYVTVARTDSDEGQDWLKKMLVVSEQTDVTDPSTAPMFFLEKHRGSETSNGRVSAVKIDASALDNREELQRVFELLVDDISSGDIRWKRSTSIPEYTAGAVPVTEDDSVADETEEVEEKEE